MPPSIHRPDSEEALAALIERAAVDATPLAITGGGTRPIGNPVSAKTVIETSGFAGIRTYEPEALTLIVGAGTPLAEVERLLASENQHLPFEPGDQAGLFGAKGDSTIGGVVAAAVSGPRAIQAGAARDSLIGVRFVTGEGRVAKNGGRVMKNVTGYDLVKLVCGAYGTLGVLTELSFKLLPRPAAVGTVAITGLDEEVAVPLLCHALASPYGVSGAAHSQIGGEKPATLIRVEGFPQSVAYRADRLIALLEPFLPAGSKALVETDRQENAEIWRRVRDCAPFHDRKTALWCLVGKPGEAAKCVAAIRAERAVEALYDWGGGRVWLSTEETDEAGAAVIRAAADRYGGYATLIRADAGIREAVGAFHRRPAPVERIEAALRRAFDPKGILNPGLMAPSLPAKRQKLFALGGV